MQLSKEQTKIHDALADWIRDPSCEGSKVVTGYAGTGKTTLAIRLVETLVNEGRRVSVVTYTGKASDVLAAKFFKANVEPYSLSTIHSLFYALEDGKMEELKFREKDSSDMNWAGDHSKRPDLILVDEMSMLPQDIVNTIEAHGIPVLFTGDPGQLGAVQGETAGKLFTPDFHLSEVHRQASESAIIQVATKVRDKESLSYGRLGSEVFIARPRSTEALTLRDKSIEAFFSLDDSKALGRGTFLCGTNTNRNKINSMVRDRLGIGKEKLPVVGETIVCLQNNAYTGLKNGTICKVLTPLEIPKEHQNTKKPTYGKFMVDNGTGFPIEVLCYLPIFGKSKPAFSDFKIKETIEGIHFFDFAYCLTVHKAQGSEWDSVYLINSKMGNQSADDYHRWLYTAVTRAAKKLVMVGLPSAA